MQCLDKYYCSRLGCRLKVSIFPVIGLAIEADFWLASVSIVANFCWLKPLKADPNRLFMSTCRHLVLVIQFVCVQKTLLSDVELHTRPPPHPIIIWAVSWAGMCSVCCLMWSFTPDHPPTRSSSELWAELGCVVYVVHAAGSEGSTAGSCNAKHHTRLNTLTVVGCNLHYWLAVTYITGWVSWSKFDQKTTANQHSTVQYIGHH